MTSAVAGNGPDAGKVARLVEIARTRSFAVTVWPDALRIIYVVGDGSQVGQSWCGRLVDDEVIEDLIAYFENSEEPMNIFSTELFKYLSGEMIGDRNIVLTISGVTMESMNSGRGGEQTKPCLHFRERDKLMVLNKTNAKELAKALGPETDLWIGGRVTIAAPMIDAFGKTTRTLRVVNVEAAEKPAVTRPATVARQAAQRPAPQPAVTPASAGPTPDDELHVMESAAADFADVVADLLKTSAAAVADRMAALGYTGVPEHGPARVQVYKALKADLGENVQAALFGTEPEPVKAGAEYRE